MSSVTTNMTRIFHRPLHFNLLNSNLKDYKNKGFLSFNFVRFNIMICDSLYNTFMFSLGLSKVFELLLSYYFVVSLLQNVGVVH
jgi:hypothetical protein